MTQVFPAGRVPYVALQTGGRRLRLARLGLSQRLGQFYLPGGSSNLARDNTIAAVYAGGVGVTAIGGQHEIFNAPLDPQGLNTAVAVRETAALSEHWPRWSVIVSQIPSELVTASIYVEAAGRTRGRIGVSSGGGFATDVAECEFDLVAETIAITTGSTRIAGMGLQRARGNWWRVWIVAIAPVKVARVLFMNGASTSYAGSTSAGMNLWGGQIEVGSEPTAPVRTGARGKMDDAIPQNWLVENLTTVTGTTNGWTLTNVTAAALSAQRAPDGSFTAVDVAETVTNGEHLLTSTGPANTLSNVVTFSVYARNRSATIRDLILDLRSTSNAQSVNALFSFSFPALSLPLCTWTANAAGGAVAVSSAVERVDDDWVRCIVTAAGATAAWNEARIRFRTAAGVTSYAGSVTEGFHLWGAEVVAGYEPTKSLIQSPLPDSALMDNGQRCAFTLNGNQATYSDAAAIGDAGGGLSHYWEVTVTTMGADAARIGVARVGSAMDGQFLGQVANQWGLLPDGNVIAGGVTVGTGPTFAQGDTIGVLLLWDAVAARYSLRFVKNPAGAFALPAVSVASLLPLLVAGIARDGVTSQTVLDVNFGQRPFKGVPPAGFVPLGWDCADFPHSFSTASLPVVDTANYRTSTIGRALVPALGRLASRPVFRRAVSCWVWGRDQRREPVSSIAVDNSDGALDSIVEFSNRDRTLALHLIPAAPAVSVTSGSRVASALVDQVQQEGGQITITARDLSELLTVPVQGTTFPTTIPNTAVHGKPRPITLGNVRWVPVVMRDGPNLDFEFHDSASFAQLVELRQNGAQLTAGVDFATPGAGGAFGFRRLTAVQGKQAARVRGQVDAVPALIERLPAMLTWIAVTKTARLTAAQLDTAGTIAALDTAAPYTLARYIGPDENLMASDLVGEVMDSFTGDLFTGADGVLQAWRLAAPAGTPAFNWTEADLLGEVKRRPDQARGLTTTLGFARNYCVHSTGEIAGAIQNTTLASELSLSFQSRTSSVALAPAYRQAVAAPPFVTLLTDGAQAQAEIDRVASIYALSRAFYDVQVMVDSDAVLAINPGTLVSLTAPVADLRQGKLLTVIAVEGELASNSVSVTLWG